MNTQGATRRAAVLAAGLVLVAVAVTGCSGSSSHSAAKSTATTTAPATSGGGSPGGGSFAGGSFPGAEGTVAAVSGSSMEVQNAETGQVTVSWTGSTSFTRSADVAVSAVKVGDCVTATGSSSGGKITATAVTVSVTSGSCTDRFAGVGHRPEGTGKGFKPPTGSSGEAKRFKGFSGGTGFTFASGKVVSVTSSSLVISGLSSSGFGRSSTSSTTTPKLSDTTVVVTSSTAFVETVKATSKDLAVGDCVTATGKTSSTGAVTASRVAITSTGGKTCTTGLGGASGASGAGSSGA